MREVVGDGVVQVLVSHVSHIAEDVHNSPGRSISFTHSSPYHSFTLKVVAICMTMFCRTVIHTNEDGSR